MNGRIRSSMWKQRLGNVNKLVLSGMLLLILIITAGCQGDLSNQTAAISATNELQDSSTSDESVNAEQDVSPGDRSEGPTEPHLESQSSSEGTAGTGKNEIPYGDSTGNGGKAEVGNDTSGGKIESEEGNVAHPPEQTKSTDTARPSQTTQSVEKADLNPPQITHPNETVESHVFVTIIGDEERGAILQEVTVEFEDGDTVLDALRKATREHRILLDYSGRGAFAYVLGIDNLYEFDHGTKSGWIYKLNDIVESKGAGTVKLSAGDTVEWHYTLDLGKDIEGETK